MYPIFHISVPVFVTSEIWLEFTKFQCAGRRRLVRGGASACVYVADLLLMIGFRHIFKRFDVQTLVTGPTSQNSRVVARQAKSSDRI